MFMVNIQLFPNHFIFLFALLFSMTHWTLHIMKSIVKTYTQIAKNVKHRQKWFGESTKKNYRIMFTYFIGTKCIRWWWNMFAIVLSLNIFMYLYFFSGDFLTKIKYFILIFMRSVTNPLDLNITTRFIIFTIRRIKINHRKL